MENGKTRVLNKFGHKIVPSTIMIGEKIMKTLIYATESMKFCMQIALTIEENQEARKHLNLAK